MEPNNNDNNNNSHLYRNPGIPGERAPSPQPGPSGLQQHHAAAANNQENPGIPGPAALYGFGPGIAGPSGYHLPGPSGHAGGLGHVGHYHQMHGAHQSNPGPSGYNPHHGAAASHMNHQVPNPAHHWYQGLHQAQMQNAGNQYLMQEEQFNMWQHHQAFLSNEYADLFGHNVFQMTPPMHHQHYDPNVNRLPSPSLTLSPSDHSSSPEMDNMNSSSSSPASGSGPMNHSCHHQGAPLGGAHGIPVGGGGHQRHGSRPSAVRSPYEWIKKSSYQNMPNPENSPVSDYVLLENSGAQETNGKTRTKDKYRIVYTDNQRIELEKEFAFMNKYITIRRKAELAQQLGLSERQIKIWFQNRRAKERKQLKKRQEERDAMQSRRLARNFATIPGFLDTIQENPLVNSVTSIPMRPQHQNQQNQSQPVNVTASGGLLTPPSGSQDVLPNNYNEPPPPHMSHLKQDPDEQPR